MRSTPASQTELRSPDLFGAFPMAATLKEVVAEASRALANLDADRLEELARSCRVLGSDLVLSEPGTRAAVARQAREAAGGMAIFARVLEATRANLNVMNRLRHLRGNGLEYSESQARGLAGAEDELGHN